MAKWLRVDAFTHQHSKMVEAGPEGMAVAKACWELAKAHDLDNGDITGFWNEYALGRATLLDQRGEPGMALVRHGMQRCLDVGLMVSRKRRGRKPSKPRDGNGAPQKQDGPLPSISYTIKGRFDQVIITSARENWDNSGESPVSLRQILIHDWKEYQRCTPKDPTAAERKRRQRSREYSQRDSPVKRGGVTEICLEKTVTKSREQGPKQNSTIHIQKQKKQVSVGSTTAAGACTRAPLHTHTHVFCSLIVDLIQEAHPTRDPGEPSTHEAQAKAKEASGVDLAEAAVVAEWAFKHSEQWANGQHWRDIIRSPDRFWRNFEELRAQHAGHKQRKPRKGQRVKPLRANSSAPKLESIDPVKYFKEKPEREKLEADNG